MNSLVKEIRSSLAEFFHGPITFRMRGKQFVLPRSLLLLVIHLLGWNLIIIIIIASFISGRDCDQSVVGVSVAYRISCGESIWHSDIPIANQTLQTVRNDCDCSR